MNAVFCSDRSVDRGTVARAQLVTAILWTRGRKAGVQAFDSERQVLTTHYAMSSRTVPVWRPFADFGRYVRTVLGRAKNGKIDDGHLTDTAVGSAALLNEAAGACWPTGADLQYFDSELRMGFMCLLLIKGGPLDNRRACARRAREIYVLLNEWVRCNGGHAGLEQRLARFRWHLDALPDIDASTQH